MTNTTDKAAEREALANALKRLDCERWRIVADGFSLDCLRKALQEARQALLLSHGCYPPPWSRDAESKVVLSALQGIERALSTLRDIEKERPK